MRGTRTHLVGGDLERGHRPGRALLEDERDLLSLHPGGLVAAVLGRLQVRREPEQEPELLRGEVELLEEVRPWRLNAMASSSRGPRRATSPAASDRPLSSPQGDGGALTRRDAPDDGSHG